MTNRQTDTPAGQNTYATTRIYEIDLAKPEIDAYCSNPL